MYDLKTVTVNPIEIKVNSINYKSNPIFTPNLLAINLVILAEVLRL